MVTPYLSELLYEHNCVILPGFGGFIANRIPSKVNEVQQRVEPARKVVSFNINLTQNDGLLASFISNSKSISFDEATKQIAEFVAMIKADIQLKKHHSLKGVGDFYLNSEDMTVFIPENDINFAKDTYGLFPISIRRITRENESVKTIEKEKLRSLPLRLAKPKAIRSRRLVYGTLLICLPVLLGLFTQQTGILQKANFNISNFFKQPAPAERVKESVKNMTKEDLKNQEQAVSQSSISEASTPVINTTPEVPRAEANTSPNIPATSAAVHFHIIGGSFGVPLNAQNFTKLLQKKGYKAYIAGMNPKGLAMVSYEGFKTEIEAMQFLEKIHQTENSKAWLLNY